MNSSFKMKSKATIGQKSIALSILLLYTSKRMIRFKLCLYVSNDLSHDTSFVWALQLRLATYVKDNFPHATDFEYYSDGCAGQYKNFKIFLNLTYHFNDFKINAVWNFFASCHGKSNCDGLGAATKRKLRNKSLTVGPQDAILTSTAAYDYCVEAMPSINFFHIDKDEIEGDRKMLEK